VISVLLIAEHSKRGKGGKKKGVKRSACSQGGNGIGARASQLLVFGGDSSHSVLHIILGYMLHEDLIDLVQARTLLRISRPALFHELPDTWVNRPEVLLNAGILLVHHRRHGVALEQPLVYAEILAVRSHAHANLLDA
jgi:hypothetical protein